MANIIDQFYMIGEKSKIYHRLCQVLELLQNIFRYLPTILILFLILMNFYIYFFPLISLAAATQPPPFWPVLELSPVAAAGLATCTLNLYSIFSCTTLLCLNTASSPHTQPVRSSKETVLQPPATGHPNYGQAGPRSRCCNN